MSGDDRASAVGLTEQEVDISSVRAFGKLQRSLLNEGAPYVSVIFGRMNYGKTSFACLLLELWLELVPLKYDRDDPVVLSNAATLGPADYVVQDIETLRELVFGDREYFESDGDRGEPPELDPDRPKFWFFDECSTHLDARTYQYEVAKHYTPLVKRFAKVNTDTVHLGHSGLDIHPELRRHTISTEFVFKTSLRTAEVYRSMDEDRGVDRKYQIQNIPDTSITYNPDDFAPFSWDN